MIRIVVLLIICMVNVNIFAHVKTNVNEVTDLFDRNIEDNAGLLREMKKQNENGLELIGSKQAAGMVPGIERVESEISELNSIKATDLDSSGRSKRASEELRFYDENELEPDYTKPGNKLHKLDADDIARATGDLVGDLMKKLKELNIDCKTVKGPIVKEPTYFIDLKRQEQRNTDYDQFFCEEPRNQYNCNDSVTLTCKRKGMGYGDWQAKTIKLNGGFLYGSAMNWGFAIKWKVGRWGWHITPYHPRGIKASFGEVQVDSVWRENPGAIIADARRLLAQVLGARIDQIGENVRFPEGGRGVGNITELGSSQRWRAIWDEYEFGYDFREVFDTCEEWAEDWTERCVLK